jgi:HAD superfamily hydrolase (TIGR01509 family)
VRVEAVIFDLDGTLTHFNLDYKALRDEIRVYLMRIGLPSSVLEINESIFEMLNKTEIFLRNNGKSHEAFDNVRTQILAIAEKYEMEAASTTSLLPGAFETLKALNQMKVKIGLCTISGKKAANYILQRFKINAFFKVVVPRDRVKYVKPNPEQFELALKTLGTLPEATIIVGDSLVDMQSAKELNAIAVGLPTGFSTIEQLISYGANYIITSLIDLPEIVKKINQN